MAKDTGLIVSLLDVASVQEVRFIYHGAYNAFFMDSPLSSFVSIHLC